MVRAYRCPPTACDTRPHHACLPAGFYPDPDEGRQLPESADLYRLTAMSGWHGSSAVHAVPRSGTGPRGLTKPTFGTRMDQVSRPTELSNAPCPVSRRPTPGSEVVCSIFVAPDGECLQFLGDVGRAPPCAHRKSVDRQREALSCLAASAQRHSSRPSAACHGASNCTIRSRVSVANCLTSFDRRIDPRRARARASARPC